MFKLNLFLIVMNQKWERGKYFLHIFGVLPLAPLSFSCRALQGTITKYLQHSSQDFSSSCVCKQESNQKSSCFRHFFSFFQKKGEVIYQQSGKRVADESFPNIRERQTRSQEDSNVSSNGPDKLKSLHATFIVWSGYNKRPHFLEQ